MSFYFFLTGIKITAIFRLWYFIRFYNNFRAKKIYFFPQKVQNPSKSTHI